MIVLYAGLSSFLGGSVGWFLGNAAYDYAKHKRRQRRRTRRLRRELGQ